jgi:hypothetical protein
VTLCLFEKQLVCILGALKSAVTRYTQEFAMSKTAIISPELAPPVGLFSQAIQVDGLFYKTLAGPLKNRR